MEEVISKLKDEMAKNTFGMSRSEAIEKGVCINCHRPALDHCYSEAGRREYRISQLCEECFDKIVL